MKLEKRRETLKNAKLPKSELNYDQFDAKARIEMKNQAKLWQQIDTKMEVFLTKLRFNGTITNKSDHEIIEKLLLPEHIRYDILKRIVEEMVGIHH